MKRYAAGGRRAEGRKPGRAYTHRNLAKRVSGSATLGFVKSAWAGRGSGGDATAVAREILALRSPSEAWWAFGDLNPGPADYESAALTS